MTPHLVVDVGNSRIKWGRCDADSVQESVSLPLDDPAEWESQHAAWQMAPNHPCCVAGSNPRHVQAIVSWLQERRHPVTVLDSFRSLPVTVDLLSPERVGLDRLLNAVAAATVVGKDRSAILVDAGSAVTVDWLDHGSTFCGGAIFPGLHLMARALHSYTAKLPLVQVRDPEPELPGRSTEAAITAGIQGAVVGGIIQLCARLARDSPVSPTTFLTGGDAPLLARALETHLANLQLWPSMTLEGIRLAAAVS